MKIVINGEILLSDQAKFTGPEVYTTNLVKNLALIDSKNKYIIYLKETNLPRLEDFKTLTNSNPNFSFKVLKTTFSWTHINVALELFKDKPDVYFTAVQTAPLFFPRKTALIPMIHGLEYEYLPGAESQSKTNSRYYFLHKTLINSKKIITPSLATRDVLVEKFPDTTKEKYEVVPEGVKSAFYKRSDKEIEAAREKFKIGNDKYFVFVSTIQPRKNLPVIIEAFAKLIKTSGNEDIKLCVSGKKGWSYYDSLNTPYKFGIEKNVLFLGTTTDEDLAALLSGAQAYINASLVEGFGLPVLEAQACGTPCIISNIPAFIEIAHKSSILVDQTDPDKIVEAFSEVLNNEELRTKLSMLGMENSKRFSWKNTAEQTLTVLERFGKNF